MSQFDTPRGPQVFLQPRTPAVYQEAKVYFPKPSVDVGYKGFDLGILGKAGEKLGVELIEAYNQQQVNKTASSLESLQQRTARLVDQFSEVNDFDGVDLAYSEYKEAARDILGFDPEDEEAGSMLGPYGKIASSARSFNANVDATVAKAKRGWADTIAFDNYITFSETENKSFIEAEDKITAINSRIQNLAKAYKDQTGVDITSPLPKSGFTVDKRRLFGKMQKDYSELLELKTKVETQKPEIEMIGESVRTMLDLSAVQLKTASKRLEEYSTLMANNPTEEQKQYAARLKAEATTLATHGINLRTQAMLRILDPIRQQMIGNIVGPEPERSVPEYMYDPYSQEALETIISSGIKTEAANAVLGAYEADMAVQNSMIGEELKIIKSMRTAQEKELKQQIDLKLSETERQLAAIDVEVKETATTPARRNALIMKKAALVNQLERDIRNNNILPTLPLDLRQKSPAWEQMLSGINPENRRQSTIVDRDMPWLRITNAIAIANSPSMGFGIGFDVESRNILASAFGDKPNATLPIYDYSIEKLNNLKSKFFDTPGSSYADVDKSSNDLREAIAMATGRTIPGKAPLSSDKMHQHALNLGLRRLSPTADFNSEMIDLGLDEIREIAKTNVGSQSFAGNRVPFGVNEFMLTPWFHEMIAKANSMGTPEEAKAYVQETLDLLVTAADGMPGKYSDYRPKGSDLFTTTTHSAAVDTLVTYIADPESNPELNAMYLMLAPKNIRTAVLERAKTMIAADKDQPFHATHIADINYLKFVSDNYNEQQSAKNYVDSLKSTNITPRLIEDTADRTSFISSLNTDGERKKAIDNARKSDSPIEKERANLLSFYYDKLIPAVSSGLSMPGWTPEISSMAASRNQLDENLRNLIVRNTLLVSKDPKTGLYDYSTKNIPEIVRKINEDIANSGYVYKGDRFGIDRTVRVSLPDGTTKTSISDDVIESAFGVKVPEEYKARAVGMAGSFTYKKDASDTESKIYLSQVADSRNATKAEYDYLAKDPFHGLIEYGILKNRSISKTMLGQLAGASQRSEANVIRELTRAAASGVQHDNLNVLASSAAIALLPPETTNMDDAKAFVSKTANDIRKAVMDGNASNYSLDIVSMKSNDGFGHSRPTLVIKTGDKILSSFQLADSSYALSTKPEETLLNVFGVYKKQDIASVINLFSSEQNQEKIKLADKLAVEFLKNNPSAVIPASNKFGYGYGFDKQYFYTTRTNKNRDIEVIKIPKITTMGNIVAERFYNDEAIIVETIPSTTQPTRTFVSEREFSPLQAFVDSTVSSAMEQPSIEERQANTLLLNADFGIREDGTQKSRGYLGPLVTKNGNIVTEYTVGVNLDGKEMDIPTLVPTLTNAEVLEVLDAADNGDQPSEQIISKAIAHAIQQLDKGQSVFYNEPTGSYAETAALIDEIQADMSEPLSMLEMEFNKLRQEGSDLQGMGYQTKQTTTVTKPAPFFDLQKALMRDIPPFFIDSPKKKTMVPNPRFFNLGKSLMRDIPSFFTK